MRSDAQILENARDIQLDTYLNNTYGSSDDYDKCFKDIDDDCAELMQNLIEKVKFYAAKYSQNPKEVLSDMIYPTLEIGV